MLRSLIVIAAVASGFCSAGNAASLLAKSSAPDAQAFEVVSLKYSGYLGVNTVQYRPPQFKGDRLSGAVSLFEWVRFACLPLVTPYRQEPDGRGLRVEVYELSAIAPAGTTLDGARAMLRRALRERLGFTYHIADKEALIYELVQTGKSPRLVPSTESESAKGYASGMGLFRRKAATLGDFAAFLSSLAMADVVDKTGISGRYSFDIDLRNELTQALRANGPGLATQEAAHCGLRLKPVKVVRKVLMIDHFNKVPSPN